MAFKKNSKNSKRDLKKSARSGFTLFELLISIGIFTVMTAVILVKNNQFKGTVVTTNLAYEVALGIRQAQVYGVDVNAYSTLGSLGTTAFSHAYGVHFDNPSSTSLCSPSLTGSGVFCLFADVDDTLSYNPGAGQDVLLETDKVNIGNSILDFCGVSSGVTYCSDKNTTYPSANSSIALSYLDVMFKRPDPSALITSNVGSGMSSATITVESNTGTLRVVGVSSVGQISVVGD